MAPDRQSGRQVHALPAGVPQHRDPGRQGDPREVRHAGARGDRGGLRVAAHRSSSTRPRTACTRSRRSWSPRSGADVRVVVALGGNALLRRGQELSADNQRDERARGLQGARPARARARARGLARQRPAGRAARAPGLGVYGRRHVPARRARRSDRGDDRLHARAGARQRAPVRAAPGDAADDDRGRPGRPRLRASDEADRPASTTRPRRRAWSARRAGRSWPTATACAAPCRRRRPSGSSAST